MGQDNPAVTIVVPVYRDLEVTRRCLESLTASERPANSQVLVINDHSPEQAVSELCSEFCSSQQFQLIVNEKNRGFVGTANRGISHASETDVILLNSDTVVAGDWVRRLQAHAYAEDTTATVTPFSNDATICSYPVIQASNALPAGWDTAGLNDLFADANDCLSHSIPTAVGFCMYIKRAVINDIGLLDEENFGQGYGEECDFSLRASNRGWNHLIAADVFVYHAGSASFAGEADARKRNADRTMMKLHPHYHQLVSSFLHADPLQVYRRRVDEHRIKQRPEDLQSVLEEHDHYRRSILDRFDTLQQEREKLENQKDELEALLGECRKAFSATDSALTNANSIVEDQQTELQKLDTYTKTLVQQICNLEQIIATMEQSRSWRYTALLRRINENN